MRTVIACFKLTLFLTLCLITIPLQALGLVLFGNHRLFYVIPHLYHNLSCAIFGIRIKIKGERVTKGHVIYVGNHLSYIDICSIGGNLPATFISKAEVKNWPIFGPLARLSKTVFIERRPDALPEAIKSIRKYLDKGRSLILFPEGTSTDGHSVLPFKSSLFEIFLHDDLKEDLTIQPFTVAIDPPQDHDIYAWYGDMEMPPHLWQLAKSRGVDLTLMFHPPRMAENYDNRKIFAKDCHEDVSKGLDFEAKAA